MGAGRAVSDDEQGHVGDDDDAPVEDDIREAPSIGGAAPVAGAAGAAGEPVEGKNDCTQCV
jgi:hypothetical protein